MSASALPSSAFRVRVARTSHFVGENQLEKRGDYANEDHRSSYHAAVMRRAGDAGWHGSAGQPITRQQTQAQEIQAHRHGNIRGAVELSSITTRPLNNPGVAVGAADTTSRLSPHNCSLLQSADISHPFPGEGTLSADLGALPGVKQQRPQRCKRERGGHWNIGERCD